VTDKMQIRLEHVVSRKKLHSHDVRPPWKHDYQNEVSAYGGFESFDGDANDLFEVEILPDKSYAYGKEANKRLRALTTNFRLRHVYTGCYLFTHKVKLPDWGFEQQEVTCNKNAKILNSVWFLESNNHPARQSFVFSLSTGSRTRKPGKGSTTDDRGF
jgi:dolichyl-phosphate-mannose-protein mannosyltransferase